MTVPDVPPVLDAYAVRLGGGRLLLASPQAVLDVLRALQHATAAAARDGIRPPTRIAGLVAALGAELADQPGFDGESAKLPALDVGAGFAADKAMEIAEVAKVLRVSAQYARYLCRSTFATARQDGRRWLVDRDEVEQHASRRETKAS